MKKYLIGFLAAIILFSSIFSFAFFHNRANTSLEPGETKLTALAVQSIDNKLVLKDINDNLYLFDYSDEVAVVEDNYYVVDLTPDYFVGKTVTVIVKDEIKGDFPVHLNGGRMLIIE